MKKNQKENFVFIGGNFIDSQLIYTIPFVISFCKEKKIKNLIVERAILDAILKHPYIKKIISTVNIIIIKNKPLFFEIILCFLPALYFFFIFKKKKILQENNVFLSDIYHSIWDTSLNSILKKRLEPNYLDLLISCMKVAIKLYRTKSILKYNLCKAFLGHTVYTSKVMQAVFRKHNISIICHANFCFWEQGKLVDRNWDLLPKKLWQIEFKKIDISKINYYLIKRKKGLGNYEDSRISALLRDRFQKKIEYPKNVIMLHIFHDSPFNVVDRSRIFVDYFEWIRFTLSILKFSEEKWSIRLHPSYIRWGENQKEILMNLINESGLSNDFFYIDNNFLPNTKIFKTVKRIVTFSGTSHLEAATFGIKPIVISKVSLGEYNKNYILKPKNIKEYNSLLLKNSNDKIFKSSSGGIATAKKILYVNENRLTFQKRFKTINVYRGDLKSKIKKDFNLVLKKLKNNIKFLEKLGKSFATNLSQK
jgi:hypothetical protein